MDNHTSCRSDDHRTIPTRLLDLQTPDGEDSIRLVSTVGEDRRYVALSHCWGTTTQFTTTKATLGERQYAIMLTQLTKTFREAVHVTRALAVRYLWVRRTGSQFCSGKLLTLHDNIPGRFALYSAGR